MKIYTSRKDRKTRKEGKGKRQDWVEEETRVQKGGRDRCGEGRDGCGGKRARC